MSRQQAGVSAIGLGLTAGMLSSMPPSADSKEPAKVGVIRRKFRRLSKRRVAFLKTSQQKDGSFSPKIAGPGITSITVAALFRNGVSPQEPVVAKG